MSRNSPFFRFFPLAACAADKLSITNISRPVRRFHLCPRTIPFVSVVVNLVARRGADLGTPTFDAAPNAEPGTAPDRSPLAAIDVPRVSRRPITWRLTIKARSGCRSGFRAYQPRERLVGDAAAYNNQMCVNVSRFCTYPLREKWVLDAVA